MTFIAAGICNQFCAVCQQCMCMLVRMYSERYIWWMTNSQVFVPIYIYIYIYIYKCVLLAFLIHIIYKILILKNWLQVDYNPCNFT